MGPQEPSQHSGQDREKHMDYSADHVARVRAAKEAAIREMKAFGDPSEYDVSIIHGQRKEQTIAVAKQAPLDFKDVPGNQLREE
jgi:hypothetical protein